MSELATSPAIFGDSDNTLLLKLATSLQEQAAVTDNGNIETARAKFGDSDTVLLLKAAHAAQSL